MTTRISTICRCIAGILAFAATSSRADDITSFETNVKPILQTRCLNCHNPDKRKGGLDMTTYRGLLTGGSGGKIVAPGRPDDSTLLGVIMHTREPSMPPSGNKLPDAEIEAIRAWIQQGCRETPAGPAVAGDEGPDLQPLEAGASGVVSTRLPLAWPLADMTQADRADAVVSIAAHPGAPVVALAGQQQILIYHLPTEKLLGALVTQPGFPKQVRFSNDGRLLLSAGGVAAQSGFVRAWNTSDGNLVVNIDHALDAVLTTDIDVDFRWCAFGDRSGVVFMQDLAAAQQIHQFKKHTDWITDVRFSPDGLLLATADRAGGVFVWESQSHNLMHSMPTHPGAVTSLAWRSDSNLLATACEDGRIRLYEPEGGAEVKSWIAHSNGALCARWSSDGRLVTVGRDNLAKTWNPDFTPAKSLSAFEDIALACAFDCLGQRVVASDYNGNVRVFDAAAGTSIGQLNANPIPLERQLAIVQQQQAEAAVRVDSSRASLEAAKTALQAQTRAFDDSSRSLAAAELELKRLRAAELRTQLDALRNQLAMAKRSHRPVYDAARSADAVVAEATKAVASARDSLDAIDKSIETNGQALTSANQQLTTLNNEQQRIEKLLADDNLALAHLANAETAVQQQLTTSPDNQGLRQTLEHTSSAKELLNKEIAALQSKKEAVLHDVATASTALASLQSVKTAQQEQRGLAAQRLGELETALQEAAANADSHRSPVVEAEKQEAAIEEQIEATRQSYEALIAEVAAAFE